jgi:hypothetical protein
VTNSLLTNSLPRAHFLAYGHLMVTQIGLMGLIYGSRISLYRINCKRSFTIFNSSRDPSRDPKQGYATYWRNGVLWSYCELLWWRLGVFIQSSDFFHRNLPDRFIDLMSSYWYKRLKEKLKLNSGSLSLFINSIIYFLIHYFYFTIYIIPEFNTNLPIRTHLYLYPSPLYFSILFYVIWNCLTFLYFRWWIGAVITQRLRKDIYGMRI